MPSHITVNGLGLTYKGTIGISTATIPDVCKTPSPGGPVPIPYPNIATQSTLKSGTTTVKAKGQMIAVKGAQFGSSNGDEAGTAGGVKSSVNMKATDWITYSFDVKFDGKNACRHTDKKFHNNKNAADLQGEVDPSPPAKSRPLTIKCKDAPGKCSSGRHKFNTCEQEEICAKIKAINKEMKSQGGLKKAGKGSGPRGYEALREAGDKRASQLRGMAMRRSSNPDVQALNKKGFKHISNKAPDYCRDKLQKKAESSSPPYKSFSVDHVKEIQFRGSPTRLSNLRWMSRRPNRWVGGQLSKMKTSGANKHTSVKGDCC